MPLVYSILRYMPIKRAKQIASADDIIYDHGVNAVKNMRGGNGSSLNLFGQMLAASDSEEKVSITDNEVRSEAANLIIAGSDTTAVTLTYLVWAVLKHRDLQTRLEEEVTQLSDELGMTELEAAPVLNSVIEETLRLYGAAPGALPRVVPTQGMTVDGHDIPAGVEVSTQAYTSHRDPRVFPEPLR
jgi:cytochrome P450